jgi:hypothetical protein
MRDKVLLMLNKQVQNSSFPERKISLAPPFVNGPSEKRGKNLLELQRL